MKAPPSPLPANATDEQKAAWRAANGLPAKAEDYIANLKLPDGVVVGEADKPFLTSFAEDMFAKGGTQAELDRAVNWFYQAQDAAEAARTEQDGRFKVDSEVALRTEWGSDFAGNMAAFGVFKELLPQDMQAMLFTARTADGQVLGNHPLFMKIGAQLGREINPAATLMPMNTGGNVATMESELAALEAKMGDQSSDYWRGPSAEKNQARYRELTDAVTKIRGRGKAA